MTAVGGINFFAERAASPSRLDIFCLGSANGTNRRLFFFFKARLLSPTAALLSKQILLWHIVSVFPSASAGSPPTTTPSWWRRCSRSSCFASQSTLPRPPSPLPPPPLSKLFLAHRTEHCLADSLLQWQTCIAFYNSLRSGFSFPLEEIREDLPPTNAAPRQTNARRRIHTHARAQLWFQWTVPALCHCHGGSEMLDSERKTWKGFFLKWRLKGRKKACR